MDEVQNCYSIALSDAPRQMPSCSMEFRTGTRGPCRGVSHRARYSRRAYRAWLSRDSQHARQPGRSWRVRTCAEGPAHYRAPQGPRRTRSRSQRASQVWPRLERHNAICGTASPGTVQPGFEAVPRSCMGSLMCITQKPRFDLAPALRGCSAPLGASRQQCAPSLRQYQQYLPLAAGRPGTCTRPDVRVTTGSLVTAAAAVTGVYSSACGDRRPFRAAAARERQIWTPHRSIRGARQRLRYLFASSKSSL